MGRAPLFYKLLAGMLCLLLLPCGCAPLTMNTEELLLPPALNERQAKVEEALAATANLAGIHYRYPQSGDYRSPFVFHDIDGDGSLEAVVFFTDAQEATVRAKVLRENADGSWSQLQELSGDGDQVDFIRFANVLSHDSLSVLIGWRNSRRGTASLEIHSFDGALLRREAAPGTTPRIDYHSLAIGDYLGKGMSEILFVRRSSSGYFSLSMLAATDDGRLTTVGELNLSPELDNVLQLLPGRFNWDNGATAVYIDERRTDTYIATEVARVSKSGLTMLVGENTFDLYGQTFRIEEVLCADASGYGDVEIPQLEEMPALADDVLGPPLLTHYMRLGRYGLTPVRRAAVNEAAGYRVAFPTRWTDNVTVQRSPESDEWRFYHIDPSTGRPNNELLRVRVYDSRAYQDQFVQRNYRRLAEKGLFLYYAYIPQTTAEPLAITYSELEGMFSLL